MFWTDYSRGARIRYGLPATVIVNIPLKDFEKIPFLTYIESNVSDGSDWILESFPSLYKLIALLPDKSMRPSAETAILLYFPGESI